MHNINTWSNYDESCCCLCVTNYDEQYFSACCCNCCMIAAMLPHTTAVATLYNKTSLLPGMALSSVSSCCILLPNHSGDKAKVQTTWPLGNLIRVPILHVPTCRVPGTKYQNLFYFGRWSFWYFIQRKKEARAYILVLVHVFVVAWKVVVAEKGPRVASGNMMPAPT